MDLEQPNNSNSQSSPGAAETNSQGEKSAGNGNDLLSENDVTESLQDQEKSETGVSTKATTPIENQPGQSPNEGDTSQITDTNNNVNSTEEIPTESTDDSAIEFFVAHESADKEADIETGEPPTILNERYEIFSSNPLPELDSPSGKAFETRDGKGAYPNLFAIICIPGFATRVDVMEQIMRQQIPGLMTLMDYGVIEWPILGKKTLALIYEKPTGGRLSNVMDQETSEYEKVEMIQTAIRDMIEALEQLGARGITHRAVRRENLFFSDETREKVLLGDFLSTPPGFDQPVIYETIENGMADEGSRGGGSAEDDLYALGIAVALLSQTEPIFESSSTEEIILSKIQNSSFSTVMGKNLITTKVIELMRGLLIDNSFERWGINELKNWQNGLPNVPNPAMPAHKAHRPFELDGIYHFLPRTLAYSMAQRPEEATQLIKDGTITNWVLKDYMDEDLTPSFVEKLESATLKSEKARDPDEVLLSHVLTILDPSAPIRYKGFSYMPIAFGEALITETVRDGDHRYLAESVMHEIPDGWIQINEELRKSISVIDKVNFGRLRSHLQRTSFGYGIERCIYELNWDFPCQSPLFEKEYVVHIEDLLPALNNIEKNVDPETKLIDREIAAFVAARVRKSISQFLKDVADPDDAVSVLGSLRLLAFLQGQYGPEEVANLSKWIGGQIGPVIKFYQSRSTQKIFEKEVPNIVRNGDLRELLKLVDNPEERIIDKTKYEEAIETFRIAQEDVGRIEREMGPDSEVAQLTSKKMAAVTSGCVMTFIIIVMLLAP